MKEGEGDEKKEVREEEEEPSQIWELVSEIEYKTKSYTDNQTKINWKGLGGFICT